MFSSHISFPLYRKYQNNKSYFKVLSSEEFEEIQFIGNKCIIYKFRAKLLPDRYLIKDLIEMEGERWVDVTESEYNTIQQKCDQGIQ